MTSVRLLQTCCISTSLNALFSRDSPLNIHKAAVVAAKRTTTRITASAVAASSAPRWRHTHRRVWSAHNTPLRRRKTSYFPDYLLKTPPPRSFAPPNLALRRMETARRDRSEHMEVTVPLQNSIDDAMLLPGTPSPVSRPRKGHERHASVAPSYADDSVPPSPSPSRPGDFPETRSARSSSTASRSTNRLSLTLPIAPPSAYPSRPTPVSTTATSFPPTPLDTPSLMSPADPNDIITAIAAQERRVLELGEDLRTAKHELDRLKRQFMNFEASRERQRERQSRRNVEPLRPIATALDDPIAAATRSAELDRRKALLLNQTAQQSTPTTENSRRRVFSGAHTRTLSLLSPTKSDAGGSFPTLHEDGVPDAFRQRFADYDATARPRGDPRPGHVAKRASWAPRSTPLPASTGGGVKQIAQDFKQGIWTFVEDLRQATVGDEPITGGAHRFNDNQDTIRASASAKPHVNTLFSEPEQQQEPTPRRTLTRSNTDVGTAAAKTKRFSWTPLTVDAYDDNDWSNWDSPGGGGASSPAAAQRWSGTTVNGDIMPSVPAADTPVKSKTQAHNHHHHQHQRSPLGSSGGKLEELLPPVLNRIPGSINHFLQGWERSIVSAAAGPEEPRARSPGRLV